MDRTRFVKDGFSVTSGMKRPMSDSDAVLLRCYQQRLGDRVNSALPCVVLQRYAVEAATIAARKQGHSVQEQHLNDGSVKLSIQVGGVA
jgi:hypothetical protein